MVSAAYNNMDADEVGQKRGFLVAVTLLMLVFSFILDPFLRHGVLILLASFFFLGFARYLYDMRFECLYFSNWFMHFWGMPETKPWWFPCLDSKRTSLICAVLGCGCLGYFFYWNLFVVPMVDLGGLFGLGL
jgi:hypothetical protein